MRSAAHDRELAVASTAASPDRELAYDLRSAVAEVAAAAEAPGSRVPGRTEAQDGGADEEPWDPTVRGMGWELRPVGSLVLRAWKREAIDGIGLGDQRGG